MRGVMTSMVVLIVGAGVARADEAGDVKACNGGDAAKCEALAVHFEEAKEPAKVLGYLEKACTLRSANACNNLGYAWSEHTHGASDVDHVKARGYYEKACGLKSGLGCFNLGNVFRLGEGTAVDLKAAQNAFERACDLGEAGGCTELGIMYYEGKPMTKDTAKALQLLQRACKLGSAVACKNVEALDPSAKATPTKAEPKPAPERWRCLYKGGWTDAKHKEAGAAPMSWLVDWTAKGKGMWEIVGDLNDDFGHSWLDGVCDAKSCEMTQSYKGGKLAGKQYFFAGTYSESPIDATHVKNTFTGTWGTSKTSRKDGGTWTATAECGRQN